MNHGQTSSCYTLESYLFKEFTELKNSKVQYCNCLEIVKTMKMMKEEIMIAYQESHLKINLRTNSYIVIILRHAPLVHGSGHVLKKDYKNKK